MSKSKLQFCNWHAAQAMIKRFRDLGYSSIEIDGYTKDDREVYGLKDLVWAYLKSANLTALQRNREVLLAHLRGPDKSYILNTWGPKEVRVIAYHVKKLPNLGYNATQRGESYHVLIKAVTNGQMTLEDSAREISLKISDILKQLATAEDRGKINAAMALDRTAFNNLINKISMEAIQKIEEEWLQLQ